MTPIDRERALDIAREDARTVYGDLEQYAVQAVLLGACWHVDYELADTDLQGGGPHYVISADTGAILERRYEQ